ncbi:GNAT family N-acetyltransferase [Bacteroidota bacterium]
MRKKELLKELDQLFVIEIANDSHLIYVDDILDNISNAAQIRGTGIAKRSPEYIGTKILEGKAIIALKEKKFAGFCYIESWEYQNFAANSGLIVVEEFRGIGLAKKIKRKAFELSKRKFPNAKLFGLTTSLAVMKINSDLGYKPVTFSELTKNDDFWNGCKSCVNHDILMRTNRLNCLCTAMLYDPSWERNRKSVKSLVESKNDGNGKWMRFRQQLTKIRNNIKPDNKK